MKKYLMAAVALICLTMTCVTLASCGDDDTTPTKEYTLVASLLVNDEGELPQSALTYMNKEFNQEVRNLFVSLYEAKSKVDEIVNTTLAAIKGIPLYATGCNYNIYYKMYDASHNVVYEKTIRVREDTYKVE